MVAGRHRKSKDKVLGRNTSGVAQATSVIHRRVVGRAPLAATAVALVLLVLGLMASSALATTGHSFTGNIGGGNFGGGGPAGIAEDQSSGDLFVSDPGGSPSQRIARIDSTGTVLSDFPVDAAAYSSIGSVAVDPAGPDVYVAAFDNNFGVGAVLKYSAAGTFAYALVPTTGHSFPNPTTVAVDPVDGTVYAAAIDNNSGSWIIEAFNDSGVYQHTVDGSSGPDGSFGPINGLAVDGHHHLYVANGSRVDEYSAAGVFGSTIDNGLRGQPIRVTATATDDVYVLDAAVNGQQVSVYDSSGTRLETFGLGVTTDGAGIAVDEASDTVYTADRANAVVQVAPPFNGPTVTTDAAVSVDPNTETLNGTINPEGLDTNFHFEFGTDLTYGSQTGDLDVPPGSADVPVTDSTASSGIPLLPNTLYHVRLAAFNTSGPDASKFIYGDDQTFTTAPAPPVIDTSGATPVTVHTASLNGSINPQGSATTVSFEYGLTSTYGTTTTPEAIGALQGDQPVTSVVLTGLPPGTTYHYRLNADNGTGGVQNGPDQTFTTAPADPAVATSVTGVTAALSGAVNAPAAATSYVFQYGTTTSYDFATVPKSVAAGSGATTFTANVAKLTPGTTYHVRVLATDTATGAQTEGADGTFTTNPAPTATTGAVESLGTDRATFNGSQNTNGLGGSYQFVVDSSTSTYLGHTDPKPVAAGAAGGAVSDTLTGLLPGQTYTVRIAVTSSGVTTLGDTVTFSTPPVPPVAPPAPPPSASANPYGCATPTLAAYNKHPKPGDTITVTGADLGVGGSVVLGSDTLTPTSWGVTGFTITLPDDAKGTLPLTVNCGTVSNTIAIAMYQAPSNTIGSASAKVKGTTATVKVKVPGPGSISIRSGHVKTVTKHAGKAATYSIKVTLNATAKKSLKKHRKLAVSLSVRFTPTGGTTGTKTVKVTFKR
jgi:hypothetical protein